MHCHMGREGRGGGQSRFKRIDVCYIGMNIALHEHSRTSRLNGLKIFLFVIRVNLLHP